MGARDDLCPSSERRVWVKTRSQRKRARRLSVEQAKDQERRSIKNNGFPLDHIYNSLPNMDPQLEKLLHESLQAIGRRLLTHRQSEAPRKFRPT
ncbi:hypothetical protein L596_006431 [Steinernema carpocapsae]|uniref:Uncharacterized protein n=1 Tax=Steinernema carpocapsae TaxID=34508 RepID=A0A4U8VA89_STECR|nr:hypothetical protein L596_006431 [Steinernema carpocapsae]